MKALAAMPCSGEGSPQLAFIGTVLEEKSFWLFFFLAVKGTTSTNLELLLIVPASAAAKPRAYPFSSAFEMTGSFQTEPGRAFFPMLTKLVLQCLSNA
jgi:hypothetical protein